MSASRSKGDPVERFLAAALEWGEIVDADYRKANRIHDKKLIPALREIAVAEEPPLIERVVELADHSSPHVALWAATFSLKYSPERAEATLKRLSQYPGLSIGFTAQTTLNEWRKGALAVAWERTR